MKFSYDLKIGATVIHIEDEAGSQKEMFEKISPMQAVEIAATGKKDVYLSVRTTKGGDKYYALVCPSEGLEFPFGVLKEGGGTLFPGKYIKAEKKTIQKWFPMQHGTVADPEEESKIESEPQSKPAPESASGKADNVRQLANRPLTADEMDRRSRAIVGANGVAKEGDGYRVRINSQVSFFVSKPGDKVVCNCERFDTAGTCEHIKAVVLFNTPVKKAVNQ